MFVRLRFSAALFALAALILVALAPLPLRAQDTGSPSLSSAITPGLPTEAMDDLATPADTLRVFLEAFPSTAHGRPDRIVPDALRTMDFTGIPLSDVEKRRFAVSLKATLDRLVFVDYDRVTEEVGTDERYVLATTPAGSIVLRRYPTGNWHFTNQTVRAIDAMWEATRDLEVVEGVEDAAALKVSEMIRRNVPPQMRERTLFLEVWQWFGLFLLVLVGVAADRLLYWVLDRLTLRALVRANVQISNDRRKLALRPLGLLAMAAVWWFGIQLLDLPGDAYIVLSIAVKVLIALSFIWASYKGIDALADVLKQRAARTSTKLDELLIPFLSRVAKIFVVVIGFVMVAQNIGVNLTSLLAGLGLGGLAFALAAKDTVENVFGSITVLVDQPFRVGDWIVLPGDVEGTVESVGLRSTRIRTFYNSLITVPNATLIRSHVDNYGMRRYRRWRTTLTVTYDTPPEKIEAFCEGLRELIRLHPWTRKDYYLVYANDFGAHSLDILFYMFFEVPDWGTELRERHRLFCDILRLAKRLGVEFAFPTQTLHLARGVPDHANAPADADQALYKGRCNAREILREQFGNRIVQPPPVKFTPPSDGDLEQLLIERQGGDGA